MIIVKKNHKTYLVTRQFGEGEKEVISVILEESFPMTSPQRIVIDVQAAREVAEAILGFLDHSLVKAPYDKDFVTIMDKISERNSGKPWTIGEEALLFYLVVATDLPFGQIAPFMGRSAFSIRERIRALGVDPGSESERSAKAATRKKNPTPRELELSSEE